MAEIYEIVIFTASLSQYARPLIEKLDKTKIGFTQLYREHCTFYEGLYFVKDLGKLGRDLRDVIIIDNSPSAYLFHKQNAIPIISWYQNKSDKELFKLIPILQSLATVPDVTKERLHLWRKSKFSPSKFLRDHQTIEQVETLKEKKLSRSEKINFHSTSLNVSSNSTIINFRN